MGTYVYELPTTGAVSFNDFCDDQTSSYTIQISEATQTRANLRGALKESKRADQDEKDYLRLVKILDEYIPQLLGIMSCVVHDELSLKSEPIFSWRTTLSANIFNSSPRLSLSSFHADLAFSLLTYAFSLSNLARTVTASLGAYEYERAISDIERKAKDEKLNFAVTLLCRASGVYSYISDTVISEWDRHCDPDRLPISRPPDLSREVNSGLAKMALADAQTLAIRKLLSKAAYDSTLTPGPPLPKSHPSPALIAKLHLECATLYSSARALAKTPGASKGKPKGEDGEVSADLRKYLADEAAFHGALAKKWLGVNSGESSNGSDGKGGEAVGFLAWAKKDLEELKSGGITIGKEKDKKDRRKEKALGELEKVTVFWKHYKKINDSLTFHSVPPQTDLQARIPAGRPAVSAKPFLRPVPAFGPGSAEHVRTQAEELDLASDDLIEHSRASGISARSKGNYSGAGSYF